MSEELKPCPFCGGGAKRDSMPSGGDEIFIVECSRSSCNTATDIYDEQCEADEAWDQRPGEEAALAQGATEERAVLAIEIARRCKSPFGGVHAGTALYDLLAWLKQRGDHIKQEAKPNE